MSKNISVIDHWHKVSGGASKDALYGVLNEFVQGRQPRAAFFRLAT